MPRDRGDASPAASAASAAPASARDAGDPRELLARFGDAVRAHDSPGFAALFTEDGRYDDGFFGVHTGREAIAAMLDRFHVGGESFFWQFHDPVFESGAGYARYVFSYRSREPESAGQLVVFAGIAFLRLREGRIAEYREAFDRGIAFTQLGYATPRIAKLLARYAREFVDSEEARAHLGARPPDVQAPG